MCRWGRATCTVHLISAHTIHQLGRNSMQVNLSKDIVIWVVAAWCVIKKNFVLSFFKKGETIQAGHYLRKYVLGKNFFSRLYIPLLTTQLTILFNKLSWFNMTKLKSGWHLLSNIYTVLSGVKLSEQYESDKLVTKMWLFDGIWLMPLPSWYGFKKTETYLYLSSIYFFT